MKKRRKDVTDCNLFLVRNSKFYSTSLLYLSNDYPPSLSELNKFEKMLGIQVSRRQISIKLNHVSKFADDCR